MEADEILRQLRQGPEAPEAQKAGIVSQGRRATTDSDADRQDMTGSLQ